MDQVLQILLIAVALALIASISIQIFLMGRLLGVLRSGLGRHPLNEIVDKAFETLDGVDRATQAATQVMKQIKPTVEQVASVSQRQLSHADQVVNEVLTGVERINHDVNAAIRWPAREAHAWSAGVRTAFGSLFGKGPSLSKEKQW